MFFNQKTGHKYMYQLARGYSTRTHENKMSQEVYCQLLQSAAIVYWLTRLNMMRIGSNPYREDNSNSFSFSSTGGRTCLFTPLFGKEFHGSSGERFHTHKPLSLFFFEFRKSLKFTPHFNRNCRTVYDRSRLYMIWLLNEHMVSNYISKSTKITESLKC